MNDFIVLAILIILLIICIIIRFIKKHKQEQEKFKTLVNRQIINENQTKQQEQEQIKQQEQEQQPTSNTNDPNDILAHQSTAEILQNNEEKSKETFLFLDSPFKNSLNYILITINNIMLKIFKTKSGYLITNKETNKIYVPYEKELKEVPFNSYTPITKIPKYIYVNVIQTSPKSLCIRKGNCYYTPTLKAWYKHNHRKNDKYVKDMIEDLGRKIKDMEHRLVPPEPRPPKPEPVPSINVNNNIDLSKMPVIDAEEEHVEPKTKIYDDAPKKDLQEYIEKVNKDTITIENVTKQLEEQQKEIEELKKQKEEEERMRKEEEEERMRKEEEEEKVKKVEKVEDVKEVEKVEEEIKAEDLLPKEDEEVKESFWSKFGF